MYNNIIYLQDPLNSGDDVLSEEDPTEVFDTENVVVCQFDRVSNIFMPGEVFHMCPL